MGQAYTPGLKVTKRMIVHKERTLPLKGDINVKKGDKVKAEDVVAATNLPGAVEMVNVVNRLAVEASDLDDYMKVKEGDQVKKGDLIAQTGGLFGFFKSSVESPINGSVENVSKVTGQVVLRQVPIPVEVEAFVDATVEEILPEEGVILKLQAAFIQGIFGIGGETVGNLALVSKSPEEELTADVISDEYKGKIIVGGSYTDSAAVKKAVESGVKGIIVGGIDAKDIKEILGYDIGVAITGTEKIGLTLIVTEGFGKVTMAQKTYDLLKSLEGKKTSINGATQIRAGVIRPEIIIPVEEIDEKKIEEEEKNKIEGLVPGRELRIIREPDFGKSVKVKSLPVQLNTLESETKVRVVEVEYEDGTSRVVPRANVEIIGL